MTGGVSLGQPPTYAGSNLHHLAPSPPVVGPWPGEPMETLLQHRWCAFLCTCALVLIPSQSQGLPRASGGGRKCSLRVCSVCVRVCVHSYTIMKCV